MKIDFKKPRYVLPLIALPFLVLFFYVYKSSIGKQRPQAAGKDSLQVNIAGVSDQVKNRPLADKLDAYRDNYKEADGYTAIGQLQEEQATRLGPQTLYNEREKRMLDSIDRAMKLKYGGPAAGFPSATTAVAPAPSSRTAQDRALAEALSKMGQSAPVVGSRPSGQVQTDPMTLFRQQMALIDSMGKANDPDYKAAQKQKQLAATQANEQAVQKKLAVSKAASASALFNTITAERHDTFITAIVDQDITGYAGSRLRIRLLEDMMAGRFLIKKGTYLYAEITGFSGQRVNLGISSIMQDDHLLPVKLNIYDNDGLPGLYVPASAFREFSKELGGNATQGVTLQQMAENNNQLVMGLLQKMFTSTTTAVGKLIRQNKAHLKYNTLVYLIDPDELKNKQNAY
ncbi:Bacteroides conjugative transposon TraM protein [Mucilaginibacter pineti]|uniref:Bacteroides conjugative transposon TraM protein n=1 Tax=Mucilaginibacter pineti TaxID=1391627 RepID=A0A1G7IF74_9SPHI|nr:conjugative transposon protein TraM [Mucilaginibacter pineti]SDF11377.1 Bacteroides conjugative transposon TraM protein [Mucilaginibacter pineti]